jgi:hypothetical protein
VRRLDSDAYDQYVSSRCDGDYTTQHTEEVCSR